MIVIVPNELRDEIQKRIDLELAGRPITPEEREAIYKQLLSYFNEHGTIPDFTLTK